MLKTIMIRSALLAFACALSVAAHAYAADPRSIDVPAGDLTAALQALAKQSGVELVYESKQLAGLRTNGVKGDFTAEEAVTKLLEGTPLTFRKDSSGAMLIAPPRFNPLSSREEREGPAQREGEVLQGVTAQRGVRLSQAENPSPGTGEEGARDSGKGEGSEEEKGQELPAPEEKGKAVPEILIKGSRSLNVDIRRSEDAEQPYIVFDRQAIERSGAINLEEFFRRRLTAATDSQSLSQSVSPSGTASQINLRGLGTDETLILVDGRRTAGPGFSGIAAQPNINGIPLFAVERIEVLPTTASGIYGGGATGGVINIVLRRDYSGVEAKLTYGNTFDTKVAARRVDFGGGVNLEGGRTNILLAGSWADAGELLVGERDFFQRLREASRATLLAGVSPPLGATTNIRSSTGGNLTLRPEFGGGSLGAPITFVPYGYAGAASDGGAGLIANAGQYNLDLADNAQPNGGARRALLNAPLVKSVTGSVRREFTPWLEGFLELSASESQGSFEALGGGSLSNVTLLPSSPANPFNESIRVTTPLLGVDGAVVESMIEDQRVAGGVIVEIPGDWRAALDYTWSRVKPSAVQAATLDTSITTGAGAAARSGETSAGAADFNIFRDINLFPVDFDRYLITRSSFPGGETTLRDLSLRLSGSAGFSLPGGAPTLSLLLEHRKEVLGDFYSFSVFSGTTLAANRSQQVDSVYGEISLPLVSKNNTIPGIERLDLQLAARHDAYETNGANSVSLDANQNPLSPIVRETNRFSSTDPTIGLRYQPIADVMLRTSYGTGFLPPAVNQLTFGQNSPRNAATWAVFGITDPLRGGEPLGDVLIGGGGNSELLPEESESWSVGIVLTPRILTGLRLSADWTAIDKADAIVEGSSLAFAQSTFTDFLSRYPERFTRGTPSGGFAVGPITMIDGTLLNLSSQKVEALDFGLNYEINTAVWGEFFFAADATRLIHQLSQVSPSSSEVESVGLASNLEWRANATASWSYAGWDVAWTTRWLDAYRQGATLRVPAQTYHDLFVSYGFGATAGILSNLEVQLTFNNIFNKSPPLDAGFGYSTLADPRMGNYFLSVRKSFGGL